MRRTAAKTSSTVRGPGIAPIPPPSRLAGAPARGIGAALVVIALAAYAGLAGTAITALGDPTGAAATRPLAVADWALGTPVLLAGGLPLWRRISLGYVTAPGLLLVSGLGGVAFALAAVIDNLLSGPPTEPAVIGVHLVIGAVSFGLSPSSCVARCAGNRWRDPATTQPGWALEGDMT